MKQKIYQLFPHVPIPVNSAIMLLIDKFKDTGNVADQHQLERKKISDNTRVNGSCSGCSESTSALL